LWIGLLAVQMVPLFAHRVLPMLEVPKDLAIARVWHSAHVPEMRISDHYSPMRRLWPGSLIYFLLDGFMYLTRVDTCGKLVLALYMILFPLSIAVLARSLRRSPWLGLLAFPLVLNRSWMFGFSDVLLGGSLAFLAMAALLRLLDEGRQQAWLAVVAVLTFLANLEAFAAFVVAALLLLFLARRQRERLRAASLALAPSLALGFAFWLDSTADRSSGAEWSATFKDFPGLMTELPKRVLDVVPGSLDMKLLGAVAATLVILCIWKGVREVEPARQRRVLVIVLGWFAAYSLLPWDLKTPYFEQSYAPRVAPFLAAALLLLPRRPLIGAQRLILLPVIAISVYLPLKLNKLYREFNRRNSGFLRLSQEVPKGGKSVTLMAGLRYSRESIDLAGDPVVPGAVYWYWGGWPLAIAGGYTPWVLDTTPFVHVDKHMIAPAEPVPDRVPLRSMPGYEFYFTRGLGDQFDREPALHIVDQFGDWTLLRRVYDLSDEP
jgi:hypothetical protein